MVQYCPEGRGKGAFLAFAHLLVWGQTAFMSFADIFDWLAHLNLLIGIPSIFGGLLVLGTLMAYISDESYREGINEFLLVLLVTTIIVLLYAYMFTDELDKLVL